MKSIELNKRFFAITIPLAVVLVGSLIGFLIIGRPSAPEASSPVILSFSSNPEIINKGESATLTWNVSNATSVLVEPGIGSVALTGSRAVHPPQDTIFTLTATNEAGKAQTTAQVFVSGPSIPTGGQIAKKIAFKSDRDGNEEIYVMNADGSNQTRLTVNNAYDGEPVWSPDNTKIAFRSDRDGNQEIYVMNADGSNQTNISNNSADDTYPAWSPDGTRIAFRSYRDGNWEIYVMNANGSKQTNLSRNSANDAYPAWSPDGKKIAFRSNRDGNYEIYVMNADGSNQTNLSRNSADDAYPVWSLDGNQIAFRSNRDGNYEIYAMNANGSNPTNLSNNSARDNFPTWSPDNTKIAFMSDRDGNSEIYVMNADGSNQINLSNNSAHDAEPAWMYTGRPIPPSPIESTPVINSFTANPGNIEPGDSSTLQWNVYNATNVSIDQGIGDVSLTGTRAVSPPGSTIFTLTATNSEGTVTATAVVMVSGSGPIPEPDKPDLVITDITRSGDIISYSIKNQGGAPAGSSSTKLVIDGVDRAIDGIGSLTPGASTNQAFLLYSYTCSGDSDTIEVQADINNTVDEGDAGEDNNLITVTWDCGTAPVPQLPDLIITNLSKFGDKIQYMIKNQGGARADTSSTELIIDGTFCDSDGVGSLDPGEFSKQAFLFYSYTCSDTSDTIEVRADATNRVDEGINENNNVHIETWSCTIPEPDLVILDVWKEGSKIYYKILNQGLVPASESFSYLQVDGRSVATDKVPDLIPGAGTVRYFNYTYVCSELQDNVLVKADGSNLIPESNEDNNFKNVAWMCGDTFTKLANPAALPTGQGSGVAFSHNSSYMAVTHWNSPYVTIYKRSGDTFTKLADPAVLPTGTGLGIAFSHDSSYMAVTHDTSPYVTIYKRSGDTFTKLADPATLPTGTGQAVAFSHDSSYMAVAHWNSPYVTIYRRSGDTFTKLADPATLPARDSQSVAFSHDSSYMAVAHYRSPCVTIYKRSGDTFTKLADPTALPDEIGNGVAFSHDSSYMAVTHINRPFVIIYKRSGDTFTKLDDPTTLPTGDAYDIAFSHDSSYMAVAHSSYPYVTIYKKR